MCEREREREREREKETERQRETDGQTDRDVGGQVRGRDTDEKMRLFRMPVS